MSPLIAKHVDSDGKIIAIKQIDASYEMSSWLRGLDIEVGDRIEFDALHVRKELVEAPALSAVQA